MELGLIHWDEYNAGLLAAWSRVTFPRPVCCEVKNRGLGFCVVNEVACLVLLRFPAIFVQGVAVRHLYVLVCICCSADLVNRLSLPPHLDWVMDCRLSLSVSLGLWLLFCWYWIYKICQATLFPCFHKGKWYNKVQWFYSWHFQGKWTADSVRTLAFPQEVFIWLDFSSNGRFECIDRVIYEAYSWERERWVSSIDKLSTQQEENRDNLSTRLVLHHRFLN